MNTMHFSKFQIISALFVIIILIALPITLFQIKNRQAQRSSASEGSASILFNPERGTYSPSQEFSTTIAVNGGAHDITGADITFGYSKNSLEIVRFEPSTTFNSVLINGPANTADGTYRIAAVNTSSSSNMGLVTLGELFMKAKGSLRGTLSVQSSQITSAGSAAALPTSNNSSGSFDFTSVDLTPTISSTPSGTTPTPTISLAPTLSATVTPSGKATASPTPTPKPQPSPAPTLPPGATGLALVIKLPGIGSNPGDTKSPKKINRDVTVEIYDQQNNLIKTIKGSVSFDGTNHYTGTLNLEDTPAGSYFMKINFNNTLKRRVPGVVGITRAQVNQVAALSLVLGDLTADNKLDIADYNQLLSCINNATQSNISGNCDKVDFNEDGIIDIVDLNIFLRGLAIRNGD